MDDKDKKIESQRKTILATSVVIGVLFFVIILMAIFYRRTVVVNTVQNESAAASSGNSLASATSTSNPGSALKTFINSKYGYQLLYPIGMEVRDTLSTGDPSMSSSVSFNGEAVNVPSFTVSASTDTTQSNNNGTLVCEKFINGMYTPFPVHNLLFYYGNVSVSNGSVVSYCTINHGIKYVFTSVDPSSLNVNTLLQGAVGSFSLMK